KLFSIAQAFSRSGHRGFARGGIICDCVGLARGRKTLAPARDRRFQEWPRSGDSSCAVRAVSLRRLRLNPAAAAARKLESVRAEDAREIRRAPAGKPGRAADGLSVQDLRN